VRHLADKYTGVRIARGEGGQKSTDLLETTTLHGPKSHAAGGGILSGRRMATAGGRVGWLGRMGRPETPTPAVGWVAGKCCTLGYRREKRAKGEKPCLH